MRPLEILLLLTALAGGVRALSPRLRGSVALRSVGAATAALVVALHLVLEGGRWQLVPVYVVAAGLLVGAVPGGPDLRRDPRIVASAAALGLLMTSASALFAWALPVPSLPALPAGVSVGTTSVLLVDDAREERYGPEPGGPRRLVAQAWYPTAPTQRSPAPFVADADAFADAVGGFLGLPPFTLTHLGLVRTGTPADVAASARSTPYPVLVYVHGWGGFRGVQLDLTEQLAAAGYVVIALDHTYGSVATELPDGSTIPIDPAALPEGVPDEVYDAAASELVATYADDLTFLLDTLERGPLAPALEGIDLDLDAVGFVGHSTGGGAAVALCARDARCGAVVGLDPWVEPLADATIGAGLAQPVLSIRSAEWVGNENDGVLGRLHAASTGPERRMSIAGTEHRDVTLLPLLSPVSEVLGLSGSTAGARTHAITIDYTRAWFERHLLGTGGGLLDREPYAEVTVEPSALG
ncbi:MAG: hypothetical protein ACLGIR_01285 [Actinomycetes bacterium]